MQAAAAATAAGIARTGTLAGDPDFDDFLATFDSRTMAALPPRTSAGGQGSGQRPAAVSARSPAIAINSGTTYITPLIASACSLPFRFQTHTPL